jgi:hypothetical protein
LFVYLSGGGGGGAGEAGAEEAMGRRVVSLGMAGWLAAALVGCAGESAYVKQLRSPLPQERFQAVVWLARHGSEKAVPNLIEGLMDEDPSVRWAVFETLKDRTGETMGYRPEDPEGRRSEAAGRWKEWWEKSHGGPVPKPEKPQEPQERPGGEGAPGKHGEVTPAEGATSEGRGSERATGLERDSL